MTIDEFIARVKDKSLPAPTEAAWLEEPLRERQKPN
jgi:hypothetical protein